ncbi:MAG: D-2-hydroxyacid dehydrogenase [Ktedonobacterales bacterium]
MSNVGQGQPTTPLLLTDYPFDDADQERLRAALGSGRFVQATGRKAFRAALKTHPDTEIICTVHPPDDLLTLVPQLRWLALASAGAEHILRMELTRPEHGLIITTANGVHAVPISEFVFSAMLLWMRHWPRMLDDQRQTLWPRGAAYDALTGDELDGATLGVIGVGAIGRRVAQLAHAFGMRVVATRRSSAPQAPDPDVDQWVSVDRLQDLLEQADVVAICVPSTPQTHHLIDATRLHQMKRSALLINIARGDAVDEDALIAALQDGTIAGAALDVFAHEPLPAESPLWKLPNVILSPHVSGMTNRYGKRLTDLLLDNLARYRTGQPLRNVVDRARGY